MNRLPLHQELYLIAHDDDGKALIQQPSLRLGLAGAVLLDLTLSGRLSVTQGQLAVYDRTPIGDTVADSLIPAILNDRANRDLKIWIKQIAEDIYDRTCGSLIAAGVLTKVNKRRLGMLAQTRYQPVNTTAAVRARAGVRAAADRREEPDAHCAALCGLVGVLHLESVLYIDQPSSQLIGRLRTIAGEYSRSVQEIVATVDLLLGEAAVAVYR
ncbi:GPP34 family phosphoprotein [Sphaerimonospora cavernae]|uniref:GPP34 family phosphoprotein n=1 Tax=Sphaerimonospora cavernae TaxID=1740611 RepID=A0ABV6U6Z8_9ACTN